MATNPWHAHALKAVLRESLKNAGVSARGAAERLGISHTAVNDWLNLSEPAPSASNVSRLLTAIDVTGDEFTRIVSMAESAGSDWMIGGTPGVNPQLAAALACEQHPALVRITECAPVVFPGLLQTGDYARNIIADLSATKLPEFELQTRVMLRIARADVITRKREPVEFHAFVGFPAIHGGIGGPQVMADQLEHALDMGRRDNITLQAVNLAGPATFAHAGAWLKYDFQGLPSAVYHEHLSSCAVLVEEADVAAYKSAAETLRREATSPEATAELIASVIPRDYGEITK